jgi:hypothetical protein
MTIDERLDRLTQNLEFVMTLQRSHDDQIARLIEEGVNLDKRLDRLDEHARLLTERTVQAMDAIGRLARIVEIHENRLDDREQRLDELEE